MINRIITLILSVLILLGIFVWSKELMILLIIGVLVFLMVASLICLIIAGARTDVDVAVSNSTVNGEPIRVILSMKNRSVLPVFFCSVKLNVVNINFGLENTQVKRFSLTGKTEKEVPIDVNCKYCGKYFIKVESVKLYDYLGIFWIRKARNMKFQTCMYPQYYNVNSISQVMRTNYEKEKYFSHRKGQILSELLQYREYVPGDNLKLINWKISGKSDELMVREFDTPTDNQLVIIFDTFEGNRVYKNLVYTVLVSISLTYAQSGISHYISWYNPVKNCIENHNIETFEDVFRIIQLIFENETERDHISINYLLENHELDKYAKVIYVTNRLTEGIQKELVVRDKIKTILVDENSFGTDDVKKTVGLLNV